MEKMGEDIFVRHWRRWIALIWMVAAIGMIYYKWNAIHWFTLSDTDDNMRMMQVRALLNGQDWYDLRQYRLNPPIGANIHWSHLVDLPIAALILATKPFFGGMIAEKIAVAIAPLLPLLVVLMSAAMIARRIVDQRATIIAAALVLSCSVALSMFMPLRIDHHGWQLAFLLLAVAGLCDPQQVRGGITTGLATALSLVVGLEMLPFLAAAGGTIGLRWIIDAQPMRMRSYAISLSGAVALGFALFTSYANLVARCDALTPVWLSTMIAAGGFLFALSYARTKSWQQRLIYAAIAGTLLGGGFAYFWPDCLGQPEQVSPELQRLWLNNISEAKPVFKQDAKTIATMLALPIMGLIGAIFAMLKGRNSPHFMAWLSILLCSVVAAILVLMQTRSAPAAQILAVPGATMLAWWMLPTLRANGSVLVRTLGVVAAFLLISGLAAPLIVGALHEKPPNAKLKKVNFANSHCPTIPAMRPLALLPAATIFTFEDLSPRLITLTHHRAIAGPYHRNGDAILDVQHVFRGSADAARPIIQRHGATLVLICPGMSESTIYAKEAPNGFYAQLTAGTVPNWLEAVALPKDSPFKLWRVKLADTSGHR